MDEIFENVEISPFRELISVKTLSNRRRQLFKDYDYVRQDETISPRERDMQEDKIQINLYIIENYLDVLKVSVH